MLYATDIITFYHPQFWGLGTSQELDEWVAANPDRFWDRVMGALVESGVTGLELTFGYGSIANVLKTFGSGKAFLKDLQARGLTIVSAFVADAPGWLSATDIGPIVADAEARAAFLVEAGAQMLVTGLPSRRTLGERPPLFIDMRFMSKMADIAHLVGEALGRMGVRLLVHTESNSVLWFERDIDLFMSLTDPRYVWLCPDSCHITLGGGDPVAVARRHAQRIALAHWKDAVGPMPRDLVIDQTIWSQQQRFMAEMGRGVVHWTAWAEAQRDTPGKDIVLIELDEAVDPVEALRAGKRIAASALG